MNLYDLNDEETTLIFKLLRGHHFLCREEEATRCGLLEKMYASEGKFDGAMDARKERLIWETDYSKPLPPGDLPYVQ